MKKATAFLLAALFALSAFGWSEEWNEIDPTNDYTRVSGRMFMELVWAVNERIAAAKSAAGDHFYDSGGVNTYDHIFPGDYVSIETNWSDEVGDFVAVTCALYKAEFWEPSAYQVSDLVKNAYEALSYFMPADPNTLMNRYVDYLNPVSADPNVPLWVYKQADALWKGTNYWNQHGYDVPMAMAWPSNPIAIMGGSMTNAGVSNDVPVYFIDYPIHESPPGKTLTNQLLNVFSVKECQTPGTPWELYSLDEIDIPGFEIWNGRADYGTRVCDSIEIYWDGTNGWWTNTTFTFDITKAVTTNLAVWVYSNRTLQSWCASPMWRYANGQATIRELYETNSLVVSTTLPISIPCYNFVPISVKITDGSLFTGLVPNVTAKVKGIRPSGKGGSGSIFRPDFADWNPSSSRLMKIKEIIDLYGSNTVIDAGISQAYKKTWYTNSGIYWNDPDHIECDDCIFPVGYGELDEEATTNHLCSLWDFALHEYVNPSYYYEAGYGSQQEICSVRSSCELSRGDSSGRFEGSRISRIGIASVQVSGSYMQDRFPDDTGFPYIKSVDYSVSITNQIDNYYDGLITNSMTSYATATFGATNPVAQYGANGTHLHSPAFVFNENDQWFEDLNDATELAWQNGPYTCNGTWNTTDKRVDSMTKIQVSGIAHWQFCTNFDVYWDMYPACTNVP